MKRKQTDTNNVTVQNPETVVEILDRLRTEYPDAGCALEHEDVFQLLVCVVLSAQTTDASVNKVTHGESGLFAKYPTAKALAEASQDDVMEIIRTIGMYKTKSKNIINLAKALVEKHDGQVPEDYDALVALPGVGRKTANVVLAVGFGHQKIAVDTHVFRVSHRIGLVEGDTSKAETQKKGGKSASAKSAGAAEVLATEEKLMQVLPNGRWTEAHHSLIFHGRRCCTARAPKCDACILKDICLKNGVDGVPHR